LKPQCSIVINDKELYPPSVNLGDAHYPDNIIEIIKKSFKSVTVVNASSIAIKAGDIRAENTALLGVLSHFLKLDLALWEKVIRKSFPEKAIAANLKAFHMGRMS